MNFKVFVVLVMVAGACFGQENYIQKTDYWKQGKAEVNVYELSQNRYNANHPGQLVSVFVTEDFLTEKQVKNEYYRDSNSTWTLKNIQLRKFTTGIYDYSLFTSTFTPINRNQFPNSLKVAASSQEWCGTIFTQLNFKNDNFDYQQRSYFEKEGDVNAEIQKATLEDELFTILRMNPAFLPLGDFDVIPALNFMQLKHLSNRSFKAMGKVNPYKGEEFSGEDLQMYQVSIPSLKRKLAIVFENKAPFKIVGWLDSFPSAFDKKIRTTKATLKKQIMTAYWGQNGLEDQKLRKELGLKP
ncbi:MAG: hypothetical protein CMB99_09545 [Flavobacteriaceae bacterium]|nr:hypothetical protein [Flavobacteriaceae bacterium]|tara:strand:+ start:424468 stop:425361 length:894 start_codon:yes stop_codon:yes gene_type:complete